MKQAYLLPKSIGGALAALSVLAAFPMSAQAAPEAFGTSGGAIQCKSGASYSTRVEWGLPTQDCTAVSQPEMKAPGGVMGPVRSSEGARPSDRTEAIQPASYGAQPTPY